MHMGGKREMRKERTASRLCAIVGATASTFALALVIPSFAGAASNTYFASPNGTGTADCSSAANSCTLATAVGKVNAETGTFNTDTISLAAGAYSPTALMDFNGATDGSVTIIDSSTTAQAKISAANTVDVSSNPTDLFHVEVGHSLTIQGVALTGAQSGTNLIDDFGS